MIESTVDDQAARVLLKTLSMAAENIRRGATREAVLKAAFEVGIRGFDEAARMKAKQPDPNVKSSGSGELFHAFDWPGGDLGGSPGNKLYELQRKGTKAKPIITYSFIESRRMVPRATQLIPYQRENIFKDKFVEFEKSGERTMHPQEARSLVWWDFEKKEAIFAKSRTIGSLGGSKTQGKFKKFFLEWWSSFGGAQANIDELGKALGQSHVVQTARVASSIERRRRAKARSEAAITAEAKAEAERYQREIEKDMTPWARKKARRLHG